MTAIRCALPSTPKAARPTSSASSATRARPATPRNVGVLARGSGDEVKQTHEIEMVIPLLEPLDIAGKTLTADGLLTQRRLATDACIEVRRGNQAVIERRRAFFDEVAAT